MMMQLRLEWLRLKGFRFFWIFLLGYFVCLGFTVWTGSRLMSELFSGIQIPGLTSLGFQQVMSLIFYFSGFFEPFLALILVMMISNDYALGTMKQHVIDGLSLEAVVWGRFLQMLLLVALSFAMVMGLSAFFSTQVSGEPFVAPEPLQVAGFLLRSLGYLSFAVLLTTWLQRPIPAILMNVVLIYVVENMLSWFFGFYLEIPIDAYLPFESFGNLVDSPRQLFGGLMDSMTNASENPAVSKSHSFGVAALYFALFWGAIYAQVKTKRFN